MLRLSCLLGFFVLGACGAPSKPEAPSATLDSGTADASETSEAGAPHVEEATPDAGAGESDPQAALATGKKDGKAVFVVFCAKWVAACAELAHVLADAGVRKTLEERFVFARVDVSNEDDPATKERMKQYKVKGLPFMVVFDRKGKEVARETGYLDAGRLSKLLDRAK